MEAFVNKNVRLRWLDSICMVIIRLDFVLTIVERVPMETRPPIFAYQFAIAQLSDKA